MHIFLQEFIAQGDAPDVHGSRFVFRGCVQGAGGQRCGQWIRGESVAGHGRQRRHLRPAAAWSQAWQLRNGLLNEAKQRSRAAKKSSRAFFPRSPRRLLGLHGLAARGHSRATSPSTSGTS